jgi:hypothetical protein
MNFRFHTHKHAARSRTGVTNAAAELVVKPSADATRQPHEATDCLYYLRQLLQRMSVACYIQLHIDVIH